MHLSVVLQRERDGGKKSFELRERERLCAICQLSVCVKSNARAFQNALMSVALCVDYGARGTEIIYSLLLAKV